MPTERLVVIGGVAAGMSAASRARKINPRLEIIVLEKGRDISYGACGLPFLISGQVARPEELVVYTPEFFREERKIDVRLEHEATEIEPGRKLIRALHRGSQPVDIHYDKLVIATGGAPALSIPGAELPNVFNCNSLAAAIRLRRFLDDKNPGQAIIIGASYIGLECAEAMVARGIKVSILERSASVLGGFEPEIARRVQQGLSDRGVRLHTDAEATAIAAGPAGQGITVQYGSGSAAQADLALLATGVVPQTTLAQTAGMRLGATGAIAVDDRMQTSVNSVYAAGDCTEVMHLVSGKPTYFPLGTTANKQGRVAGENAAGGNARFDGIVGTLATKVFDLEVAKTGLSTQQARADGFQPGRVVLESYSHAKYLGGKPLSVVLIWDQPSGRVLGCQMIGEEGAAKRVDAAAVALHARMRVEDLLHLDLSYAPPFGTVWEPLLIAAHEAVKRRRGG